MSPAEVMGYLAIMLAVPLCLAILVGAAIHAGRGLHVRRIERAPSHKAAHVPRLPAYYKARRCFEEARSATGEVVQGLVDAVLPIFFFIPILAGAVVLVLLGILLYAGTYLGIKAGYWWDARNESQRADGMCTILGSIGGYGLSVSLGLPFWTGFLFLGAVILYFVVEHREVKKGRANEAA